MEIIHQWQLPPAWHPVNPKLIEDEALAKFNKIGVSSLQSYFTWGEIEKEPGRFDFSSYDLLVGKLRQHNLKWVPFLLLGQDYATPKWFQNSPDSLYLQCLEHNKESKAQSIWNPNLPKYIERFLKTVSDHYQDKTIFESILLGISGDWGETIFSASGGYYPKKVRFHTHAGFWCADPYAKKSFQEYALGKYSSLGQVNIAWSTDFKSEQEITFPAYEKPKVNLKDRLFKLARRFPNWLKVCLRLALKYYHKAAGENRDFLAQDELFSPLGLKIKTGRVWWLDFQNWYFESMNSFTEFWLKTARSYFPEQDIYIVAGGSGSPQLGADFTAQTKLAARYNAGVRITNQSDDYAESFVLARLVSSAARFYSTYYSTESANKSAGTVPRLFDAVSSQARGIYYWALVGWGREPYFWQDFPAGQLTQGAELLKSNLQYISSSAPVIDTAVFFPNTAINFNPQVLESLYKECHKLRDLFDFDLVDETMIKDGALPKYKYLLVLDGQIPEGETLAKVEDWKGQGGVLTNDWQVIPKQIDGEADGVYATSFPDRILYFNSNDSKVVKRVEFLNKVIEIEPRSISSLNL